MAAFPCPPAKKGTAQWAELVAKTEVGRVRICKVGQRGPEEVAVWIERCRQLWNARFGELDQVVDELKQREKIDGRKKKE